MKKSVLIFCILMGFVCIACNGGGNSDIVLENEQFRLIIGTDAIAKSLILKSTGEDCLMQGEPMAIFSVTQERPFHNELKLGHPNKKTTFQADTIYRKDDHLIVGFELVPWEAIITIRETPSYIGFTHAGFQVDSDDYPGYLKITPPPATELCILQLPIRKRTYFGEWLNVSWDDKVAINVLATDPYAYIDFEKRNGFHVLTATALKDIQFEGTGVALIVCESGRLLNNIDQLEKDFDLPKGAESRKRAILNTSYYWTAYINPGNVDEHIKYAKLGGFRTMSIYYPAFEGGGGYNVIGDYEVDRKLYPNGIADLKVMLDKIKAAGITPGVHILHSHIGRNSRYVTPVPDFRLNILRTFNLAADLGKNDTTLYVDQNPAGLTMADGCRVLKVGTELISYRDYTTDSYPYRFTGCVRGVDKTTINSQSKGSLVGLIDVSEYGATSVYINQRTSLQDEIAEKIAKIWAAGFQFVYFDGSEGVEAPFGINVAAAQYKVFRRMQPQPLFAEGAAKSHFSWHMLSGGNAFDVFPPEQLKAETKKWPAEEAPRMKQDFTRLNFGWMGYWVPSDKTIGTQPDQWEYVTAVAAAWDCPTSVHSNLNGFATHPRTGDNLEVLRRWEEVRATKWLTNEHKKMLQKSDQEHHLLINEQGKFELLPYYQIQDAAGKNNDVIAFCFMRENIPYVLYWHTRANKKLELPLNASDVKIFTEFGREESILDRDNGKITLPLDNRRYIKAEKLTKQQLTDALKNAQVID